MTQDSMNAKLFELVEKVTTLGMQMTLVADELKKRHQAIKNIERRIHDMEMGIEERHPDAAGPDD